jgi:hypothetical protein
MADAQDTSSAMWPAATIPSDASATTYEMAPAAAGVGAACRPEWGNVLREVPYLTRQPPQRG